MSVPASMRACAIASLILPALVSAQLPDRSEQNQSFGAYILASIDEKPAAQESEPTSTARAIVERSIEIRRLWAGEGAVTDAEEEWYKQREKDEVRSEKPGGGPPPWAPAHGYRRKFGEQQEQDLGGYVHQCVQEGLRGDSLIFAIQVVIDRVSQGGEVGDRRSEVDAKGSHPSEASGDVRHETDDTAKSGGPGKPEDTGKPGKKDEKGNAGKGQP